MDNSFHRNDAVLTSAGAFRAKAIQTLTKARVGRLISAISGKRTYISK